MPCYLEELCPFSPIQYNSIIDRTEFVYKGDEKRKRRLRQEPWINYGSKHQYDWIKSLLNLPSVNQQVRQGHVKTMLDVCSPLTGIRRLYAHGLQKGAAITLIDWRSPHVKNADSQKGLLLVTDNVFSLAPSPWVKKVRSYVGGIAPGYDLIVFNPIGGVITQTDKTPGRTNYPMCMNHMGVLFSRFYTLLNPENGMLAVNTMDVDEKWLNNLQKSGFDCWYNPDKPGIFRVVRHTGSPKELVLPEICNRE